MKFCPNCGFPLDGNLKCSCGYDVETGKIDDKDYDNFKEKEKNLYEQSCDNMIIGARMMGIDSNLSDSEVIKQFNQTIFNKDNDNIYGEELSKIMQSIYNNKEKK